MALDSAEKRRSTVSLSYHYYSPSVTPNTLKDVEWRQQSGHGYSGILADPPVIVVPPVPAEHRVFFTSDVYAVNFSALQRETEFNSSVRSITIRHEKDGLGYLLREDGGFILREDGFKFLRER